MKGNTVVIIAVLVLVALAATIAVPLAFGAGGTYDYTFTAVNKMKLGTVTLTKVDDLGNPVSGAAFTLTCAAPPFTSTLTTPVSGLLTWTALKWGDYTLSETFVPEGYTADPAFPKSFHIGK
jgi:uncharacterized surface anchored protein